MIKESKLFLDIELMRKAMYQSAMENGISHSNTIKMSQELDKLLNSLMQLSTLLKGGMNDV